MTLYSKTAHELIDNIKQNKISPKELLDSVFKRIEAVEDKVQGFISYDKESAYKQLEKIEKKHKKGRVYGIPVVIKDNICFKGHKTTCASKILYGKNGGYISPYSATVVEKLINEDAIIIGASNMDEFAMGSSTENSGIKLTHNPWDLDRVPGGSSGGSAALVSADETIFALGSDTGGSIRQPASFCGIVGLKPIYGEVSRYGLIAFASSLDQIGPLTKDVTDAALVMDIISGHDPKDSTSIPASSNIYGKYMSFLKNDVSGITIGFPKECKMEGLDPEVENAYDNAKKLYKSWGAKVVDVSLPHIDYSVAAYYIIATAEASSNLARFDGVQYGHRSGNAKNLIDMYFKTREEGFGPEVKRRILLGSYVLSSGYYDAYYKKAQKVRTLIKQDFEELFKQKGIDCLVLPTAPSAAFKIGEKIADPLQMYLSDIFTISANLAGLPAISLPGGFTKKGLPIGMQIIADSEDKLFQAGYTFEQRTDYHTKRPGL